MQSPATGAVLAAATYLPLAILFAVAIGLALFILAASHLVGPRRSGPIKSGTYESGMDPVGDTRRRFHVRFYLIAVLFLVFDVEVLFLYPWAILASRLRGEPESDWAQALSQAGFTPGFLLAAIGVFFILLLVGLIYEWRRGVFKWN